MIIKTPLFCGRSISFGSNRGYTLIELLVVVTIIAVLLAIMTDAIITVGIPHANCARCASNMHNLVTAFNSYALDNNGNLPGRIKTGQGDKWPILLYPYVNSPQVYIDPSDPVAQKIPVNNIVVNSPNNSSYIFNGFNDLGFYQNSSATITLQSIPNPGALCILGVQIPGGSNFYLDLQDGDQNTVLKKTEYFNGSNYAFADMSVRFMPVTQYTDSIWEVNSNYVIPTSTH
jgi:prepilin-type N-terminal cleavage/methylation domain-containing protein